MLHGNGTGHGDGNSDLLSDRKMTTPCRPPVIRLTRLDDRFRHCPRLLENKKTAGAAVQAACALRPDPTGSVSYSVVHIKSAMLSDWMVMVVMNANGDDDNVGTWEW